MRNLPKELAELIYRRVDTPLRRARAEIDAHDAVLRFNAAPTKGFLRHVGAKTTLRLQNVDNMGWAEPQDTALIFSARSAKVRLASPPV